jgi:hypothetical protein
MTNGAIGQAAIDLVVAAAVPPSRWSLPVTL